MNIIEWAATAKEIETDCDHEGETFGFDKVLEHEDGSWIGVVTEPQDTDKYFVVVANYNEFFAKLTDAQVQLWERHARYNQ